jgi:cyclic dehypoxanthinyl futalosine synthase
MAAADLLRRRLHPDNRVGWMIDRNVNITNVCVSMCRFCNFCRAKNHVEAYTLSLDDYRPRIEELFALGGNQLLLQGGMHPDLGLTFYTELFRSLKSVYPTLKLHALGPPEIVHIAHLEGISEKEVLEQLTAAGLDSLPGAGAEILADRVRKVLSPKKCTTSEWLEVMRIAHQMGLVTSATMMFGHIETQEERIEHLLKLRDVQKLKPSTVPGFLSFIPWPFQDEHTVLREKLGVYNLTTAVDYLRLIAIARLILTNIPNIQASWLTVGKETAQLSLHAGANDFGSIMIEEKVVSVAGATHRFDAEGIQQAIREAGFIPAQRNQRFERI